MSTQQTTQGPVLAKNSRDNPRPWLLFVFVGALVVSLIASFSLLVAAVYVH